MNIPFYGLDRQYKIIGEELIDASHQVLKTGQFIDGPYTQQFEQWLSMKTGYPYAITVHSGTQALEIIARANAQNWSDLLIDIPPSVIIPELTYIATLNAFLTAGYKVKIQEVDSNGILDVDNLKMSDPFIEFVCPVGLFGAPLGSHKFNFVDGAQHWLVHDSSISESMAISFDPTKNLPSSGNGGAIVTRDLNIYDYALACRNNGKKSFVHYDIETVGTNSKMSEQDCAQIMVRTRYLDFWQKRRREIRLLYLDRFKNLPLRCLSRNFTTHADQKFVVYLNEKRDDLQQFLSDKGIETKVHYRNTISQHFLANKLSKPDILSKGTMLAQGVLSLPIYPELADAEVEYIADKVCEFFT